MAKKSNGDPAEKPEDNPKRTQITLDPDVAREAGMVAADLQITLSDYVNSRLGPVAAKDLKEVFRRRGFLSSDQ